MKFKFVKVFPDCTFIYKDVMGEIGPLPFHDRVFQLSNNIILSGDWTKEGLYDFCKKYPSVVYPFVETDWREWIPNREPVQGEIVKFSELDGDAYGRMAHVLSQGRAVLNEILCFPRSPACLPCGTPIQPPVPAPRECSFYNRVLDLAPVKNPIVIMDEKTFQKYFPFAGVGPRVIAKREWMYFDNTDEFRKDYCIGDALVRILIAEPIRGYFPFPPRYNYFLGFWNRFGGNRKFYSNSVEGYSGRELPVFRYNFGFRRKL